MRNIQTQNKNPVSRPHTTTKETGFFIKYIDYNEIFS